MVSNTDNNQGGDFSITESVNAFPEAIIDFPYFSTSDWSFDPINLDNVELF